MHYLNFLFHLKLVIKILNKIIYQRIFSNFTLTKKTVRIVIGINASRSCLNNNDKLVIEDRTRINLKKFLLFFSLKSSKIFIKNIKKQLPLYNLSSKMVLENIIEMVMKEIRLLIKK